MLGVPCNCAGCLRWHDRQREVSVLRGLSAGAREWSGDQLVSAKLLGRVKNVTGAHGVRTQLLEVREGWGRIAGDISL